MSLKEALESPVYFPYPWTRNQDGTRLTLKTPQDFMIEVENHYNMSSFDWGFRYLKRDLQFMREMQEMKSHE